MALNVGAYQAFTVFGCKEVNVSAVIDSKSEATLLWSFDWLGAVSPDQGILGLLTNKDGLLSLHGCINLPATSHTKKNRKNPNQELNCVIHTYKTIGVKPNSQ
jgi:hypothetical protein